MQVTIFGACHILAMSSTCTNPVLYGFLNKNMKDVSIFDIIFSDIISYLIGIGFLEIIENKICWRNTIRVDRTNIEATDCIYYCY